MKYLDWVFFKALLLFLVFGFFGWSGTMPNVALKGSPKSYVSKNGKAVKIDCNLKKGMVGRVHFWGEKNFAMVKFTNNKNSKHFNSNIPESCRDKELWIPYKNIPSVLSPKNRAKAEAKQVKKRASKRQATSANSRAQEDRETEACVECSHSRSNRSRSTKAGPVKALAELFSENFTPLVLVKDDPARCINGRGCCQPCCKTGCPQVYGNCDKFIHRNTGALGPYGRGVLKAIDAVDGVKGNCFAGNGITFSDKVCPGYSGFSPTEKLKFWVYVLASISHDEGWGGRNGHATCDPNARNLNDGDGGSDGLFQLEYLARLRESSGRTDEFCPHTPIDSQNLDFQFRCSASMLKDVYCDKPHRTVGHGTASWSKLKNSKYVISRMIKEYPGCRR